MSRKIFISLIYVLLIGFFITGILSYRTIESTYNKSVEEKLISNAYLVKELVMEKLKDNGFDDISDYIHKIKTYDQVRITIIDTDGKVLADNEEDISIMDNHKNRPEVKKALAGTESIERRYSDTIKADYLYIALPVKGPKDNVIVVRLSMPLKEINLIMKNYLYNLLIAFILGLIMALTIGFISAKKLARPLMQITKMSDEIAKGKFNVKLRVSGKDEIAKLADTINHMSEQLQYYISGLNTKNKEMEAILRSVPSGLIAINNNQRILFINKNAKKILGIDDDEVIGKHIIYILRNQKIQEYIENSLKNKKYEEFEVSYNYPIEKVIKLYINPILESDKDYAIGIIIVLQDVTQVRKLEKVRSEFAANVSHELKTPLTSIKGFIETLREGAIKDEKTALKFLHIIEKEAERLVELINDILILSELENKKVIEKTDKININQVVEEIMQIIKSKADNKEITIENHIDKSVDIIYGSKDKFKQMIINIVDNAIKYSNKGGKIIIKGYLENGKKVISIEDFGIGIPEEDLPRIFERFYRVDKARSKTGEGGTGLGLSIVKHIARSFNAEIFVESKLGKGTKFIIKFPK